MKKTQILAIAALAAAATFQTAAKAEDPVSPVPGAVCNLYNFRNYDLDEGEKGFSDFASVLEGKPAAATFVDTASDFKACEKMQGVESYWGMWTGWLKQEKAGMYTFTCKGYNSCYDGYSVWINGQKCASGRRGQYSFNVELLAGFNSVKIISEGEDDGEILSITYKKAGSLKEPVPFGPGDMFHDDEE